jgi:hypothetical protein
VREGAVLGGVDDHLGAGHRGGGRVDLGVEARVLADVRVLGRRKPGPGEAGDVPGAFDDVPQRVHPIDVDIAPVAERELADALPERAGGEPGAATAALVVADIALPEVDDLAQRAHGGQFA